MAEIYFQIRNCGVLTARIDPTNVRGDGSPHRPVIRLPLELQVLPAQTVEYTLIRLTGILKTKGAETLAEFDAGPLAQHSDSRASYRPMDVQVALDPPRVRRFEEVRSGADAFLPLSFRGLVWFPKETKFDTVWSQGDLPLTVPRSTWVDQVLPRWGLASVKLVEIRFPASDAGENFRAAYGNVEAAEKLYASGQWKQVLAELHSAFQRLAKSYGCENPDQQFFVCVLEGMHPAKKEKMKLALDYLCEFLHLGRKETRESPETFSVSPKDARFALTMAHAIFEYITPSQ